MILSPLEQFNSVPLITLLDSVWASNMSLYSAVVLSTIVGLTSLNNGNSLVPSTWSVLLESIYLTLVSLAVAQTGRQSYIPLVYALFS